MNPAQLLSTYAGALLHLLVKPTSPSGKKEMITINRIPYINM